MSSLIRPSLGEQELHQGSDFVVAEWSAPPTLAADGRPERMAPLHVT